MIYFVAFPFFLIRCLYGGDVVEKPHPKDCTPRLFKQGFLVVGQFGWLWGCMPKARCFGLPLVCSALHCCQLRSSARCTLSRARMCAVRTTWPQRFCGATTAMKRTCGAWASFYTYC
jgi:hypothetical protein